MYVALEETFLRPIQYSGTAYMVWKELYERCVHRSMINMLIAFNTLYTTGCELNVELVDYVAQFKLWIFKEMVMGSSSEHHIIVKIVIFTRHKWWVSTENSFHDTFPESFETSSYGMEIYQVESKTFSSFQGLRR